MRYRVGCDLDYWVPSPSTFVFNVAATRTPHQEVEEESLTFTPDWPVDAYSDAATGNRYHRVVVKQGSLAVRYQATVALTPRIDDPAPLPATPPDQLPLELLPYVRPSRYCQSDQLMRLAYREFGGFMPSYTQVNAICNWIHSNVDYLFGSTGPLTSAFDVATSRAGVCRDFAHLGIAFCRAVNIPARFVSGYAYDLRPPDFHAVFEAWLGERWYLFDPTRQVSPAGLLRIGTGRDAADVSFAFIFGPAVMTSMNVYAEALDETAAREPERAASFAVASA